MADSVRLTGAADPRVMIGGIGEFGSRVAGFLTATLVSDGLLSDGPFSAGSFSDGLRSDGSDGLRSDGLCQAAEFPATASGIGAAFAAGPGAVVLASWRPEPDLCELADQLSFRQLVPWLPVIMEHPVVRIGPLVDPAAGPCFGCYSRRRAQHDRQPWITATLQASSRCDDSWSPVGYLPHQARMAAAVAVRTLSDRLGKPGSPAGSQLAGEVTTIGLSTGSLQANPVIACHNCDRCAAAGSGETRAPARLARLAALAASLQDRTEGVPALQPDRVGVLR